MFCGLPALVSHAVGSLRARVSYHELLHLCERPFQTGVIMGAIFLGLASALTACSKLFSVLSTGITPGK